MKEDRFCLYTAWKRLYKNDKKRDKSKDKETALLAPKTFKDTFYERDSSRGTYERLTDKYYFLNYEDWKAVAKYTYLKGFKRKEFLTNHFAGLLDFMKNNQKGRSLEGNLDRLFKGNYYNYPVFFENFCNRFKGSEYGNPVITDAAVSDYARLFSANEFLLNKMDYNRKKFQETLEELVDIALKSPCQEKWNQDYEDNSLRQSELGKLVKSYAHANRPELHHIALSWILMEYLLGPNVNEIFWRFLENPPSFSKREQTAIKLNQGIISWEPKVYVSRPDLYANFKDVLKTKKEIWVTGSPGIGKTEFVCAAIRRLQLDNPDVNGYLIPYRKNLFDTFISELPSRIKGFQFIDEKGNRKSNWQIKNDVLNILQDLSSNDILVFDNVESDKGPLRIRSETEYSQLKALKAKLIFISQTKKYSDIEVGPMSEDELLLLTRKIGLQEEIYSDQKIKDLLLAVNHNTFLVSLAAKTLQSSPTESIDELSERLLKGDFNSPKLASVESEKDREYPLERIDGHLRKLLAIPEFLEKGRLEREMLINMLIIPENGIKQDIFLRAQREENADALNLLIDSGWIKKNEDHLYTERLIKNFLIREWKVTSSIVIPFINRVISQNEKNYETILLLARLYEMSANLFDAKWAFCYYSASYYLDCNLPERTVELANKYLIEEKKENADYDSDGSVNHLLEYAYFHLGQIDKAKEYSQKSIEIVSKKKEKLPFVYINRLLEHKLFFMDDFVDKENKSITIERVMNTEIDMSNSVFFSTKNSQFLDSAKAITAEYKNENIDENGCKRIISFMPVEMKIYYDHLVENSPHRKMPGFKAEVLKAFVRSTQKVENLKEQESMKFSSFIQFVLESTNEFETFKELEAKDSLSDEVIDALFDKLRGGFDEVFSLVKTTLPLNAQFFARRFERMGNFLFSFIKDDIGTTSNRYLVFKIGELLEQLFLFAERICDFYLPKDFDLLHSIYNDLAGFYYYFRMNENVIRYELKNIELLDDVKNDNSFAWSYNKSLFYIVICSYNLKKTEEEILEYLCLLEDRITDNNNLDSNWNYGINCFFYLLADTTEEAIKYVKMAKYYLEKNLVILEGLEGEEARNWKSDCLRDLDCYEILIELLNNCLQNKELKNPLKEIINDYLKGDSQYAPLHFREVVSALNSMSEQ